MKFQKGPQECGLFFMEALPVNFHFRFEWREPSDPFGQNVGHA